MPDDLPLVRQWLLLKMLSAHRQGITVREMAKESGVGEKTIRRDLQVFQQVGFPVEGTVGEFGRKTWRFEAKWNAPDLAFAFDEVVSLYLARRFLEPLAGTVFGVRRSGPFARFACLSARGPCGTSNKSPAVCTRQPLV